jgi:hypothetical protein
MLYRSSLVRFGPAQDMFVSDRALIKQFLAGSNVGPIGMDEMVDAARGEADVAALLAEGDPAASDGHDPRSDTLVSGAVRPDAETRQQSVLRPHPDDTEQLGAVDSSPR